MPTSLPPQPPALSEGLWSKRHFNQDRKALLALLTIWKTTWNNCHTCYSSRQTHVQSSEELSQLLFFSDSTLKTLGRNAYLKAIFSEINEVTLVVHELKVISSKTHNFWKAKHNKLLIVGEGIGVHRCYITVWGPETELKPSTWLLIPVKKQQSGSFRIRLSGSQVCHAGISHNLNLKSELIHCAASTLLTTISSPHDFDTV